MSPPPALLILLLCFLSFLFLPQYLPEFLPLFFTPYIVRLFWGISKKQVLIWAFFVGLFCDISSSYIFGIHTLLYVSSAACTYGLKRFFLKDKFFSLPLVSAIFSFVFSSLAYPSLAIFTHRYCWDASLILLDIRHAILIDFPYSTLIYLLPFLISLGSCKIKKLRGLSCY
ncbi:hypothetical protein CPE1_0434 [Chlamydia pecorum PV3056/3]|uniref:Membrane protein n=1 Tax=Chlamydia pecorum TaxID=85991 RepID=A0AA40U5T5_9CHLA|nr:hypothetical protein CPE1_0434 [Chlamydia pecorum PV3056/3]KTF28665.1 putative membrane protein [Chlamydia pecorum]KZN26688.1 putative membrane protein [Chlamydia pecorum]KZN26959.1 putative membrane protein [Chlamydia pecorum]